MNPGQSFEHMQQEQYKLATYVIRKKDFDRITTVAGVDVSYRGNNCNASAVLLSFPTLTIIEHRSICIKVGFPYIPGYLSYREGPPALKALSCLTTMPDLIITDGHGIAHPRRFGIASHIGLTLDIPSVGCAKNRLYGTCEEPGHEKGDYTLLFIKEEIIGAAVRTRKGVKPVFVSIGHRIDLESAIEIVLHCCTQYRLPEPVRLAHRFSKEHLQE
jgi:deoxyribonuclease V